LGLLIQIPSRISLICAIRVIRGKTSWLTTFLSHDSFPFKFGVLKIQKKSELQRRDVEIPQHLRNVGVIKSSDDLWIGNHQAIYNQVRNEFANYETTIMYGKLLLLIH